VDPLREHDVELARAASAEEKAEQALEAMRFGIQLKWTALRTRYPNLTDADIDKQLLAWLGGE
jgi:hypothetical protein